MDEPRRDEPAPRACEEGGDAPCWAHEFEDILFADTLPTRDAASPTPPPRRT